MGTWIADGLSQIVPYRTLPPSVRHAEYAVDGLSPMGVVVPEDREQVVEVMRWASENGRRCFRGAAGRRWGWVTRRRALTWCWTCRA